MISEKEFYTGLGSEAQKQAGLVDWADQKIFKPVFNRIGGHMAEGATNQVTNNIKDTVTNLPWKKIGLGAGAIGLPLLLSGMFGKNRQAAQSPININIGGGAAPQQGMSFNKPHSITG